jgi:hypothetical protein
MSIISWTSPRASEVILLVLGEQLAEAFDHAGPKRGRDHAPGSERILCPIDGSLDGAGTYPLNREQVLPVDG